MPSNQEQPTEMSPTLGLLHLMIDLEVLSAELQVAEEAIGRPSWAYRDFVTDRLTRVGVTTQKIEDFSTWEGTISGLTSITSRNEAHLAKIAAAEKAGLIVLTALHWRATTAQPTEARDRYSDNQSCGVIAFARWATPSRRTMETALKRLCGRGRRGTSKT